MIKFDALGEKEIFIVGMGRTGSWLSSMVSGIGISKDVVVADGGTVKKEDVETMMFSNYNRKENKAKVVANKYGYWYISHDIKTSEDIIEVLDEELLPIIINCTNSQEARKVIHNYFNYYAENCVWIDIACNQKNGQVYLAYKKDDTIISASPLCESSFTGSLEKTDNPDIVTSITAATMAFNILIQALNNESITGSLFTFDTKLVNFETKM